MHTKTNLNQSADSNDYNAPIPKYTIVWDWIIYVICSLCLNNEIIIEIKLILLLKTRGSAHWAYIAHLTIEELILAAMFARRMESNEEAL